MKRYLFAGMLCLLLSNACKDRRIQSGKALTAAPRILVYSATKGFRHASIPDGIQAIKQLALTNGWEVNATEDSLFYEKSKLEEYAAIVLLNTTGDVFDSRAEQAIQSYIRSGGGIAGVHAAADCEYAWPWYNRMIGAYFESHPEIQTAALQVLKKHPSTIHLGETWMKKDEWYNFKSVSPDIQVIMNLDESTYTGGKMGSRHPIAWHQEFEGGKVFYTALGHTRESYSEPLFLKHLEEGIRSVMK